jgi:hypothetical protein
MTALVIPEDVWILHILDYLDSLALSRLARTCRTLREHTDAYRNSCAYGRRLALAGLRRVHSLLVARHTKCAGQSGLAELTKSVGAYTTRLCVSYHDLPAAAAARRAAPEEEPGRRHERQIAAAVGGRDCATIVKRWGRAEIAAFLVPFATQVGSDWCDSSAAIAWALWALDLATLRRVIFAPDPCAVLAEEAESPEQVAIAHMIRAIFALRDIPAPEEEKGRDPVEYARAKEAGLLTVTQAAVKFTDAYTARVGSKDPKCLEFALAGGALAINHSLKVVPKSGRYHYARAIYTSLEAGRLRAIGSASEAVLKSLGLIGPARQVSALEDFRCNLSAPDPDDVGALLAAILAFGPGGGPPAAVMVGPGGAAIPMPPAMLAALLMGPGAFGGGGGGDEDGPPPLDDA